MMKSINVSTKITILILAVSLVAVAAISFFSYDYQLKTTREKYTTVLNVIADNRAAFLNTYLEKGTAAVKVLQVSDIIKGGGASTADPMMGGFPDPAAPTPDSTAASVGTPLTLKDYLEELKYSAEIDQIYITSPTGSIVAQTDTLNAFIDPDGLTFTNAKSGIHYTRIILEKGRRYSCYVAGSTTTNAGQQNLIIVKLALDNAYDALKNYQGLGKTGEALVAFGDSKNIYIASPLRKDTDSTQTVRPRPIGDAASWLPETSSDCVKICV